MTKARSAAQHKAQIRLLRRSIAINTPIISVCFAAAVCSFVFDWHIVVKVFLTFVSFMQLMHLPSLFTRLAEQKRKLAAIESSITESTNTP